MMIRLPWQSLCRTLRLTTILNKNMSRKISSISVSPDPSMSDEKVGIVLRGLPISKTVTVYASTPMSKDCLYESFAHYETSKDGTVDLKTEPSIYGSYVGVEPMGLFWAMKPYATSKNKIARFLKKDVTTPLVIKISVFDEEIKTLEEIRNSAECKPYATAEVNRLFMKPGVRRIEVRENGLIGTLFLPPGKGPFPGLINLFGGYPGVLEFKSALQASHGFASLALAYIGLEGLPPSPTSVLDLSYFEEAVQFLKRHDSVMASNGIGVVGMCKGAQIAAAMCTYLEDICCAVMINGSVNAVYGSLKYKDKFFKQHPVHLKRFTPTGEYRLIDYMPLPQPGLYKTLPGFFPLHKQTKTAVMFICGLSDLCVPVKFMADELKQLLQEENHPDYEIIEYPNTGHLIEPPYAPFRLINLFGGYPGVLEFKSALHASHGFASLALAYLGMGHLPQSLKDDLDLGYFEKAVQFLKCHDDVTGNNGIGLMGICKGAQIALGMAALLQDIRCVVSINGNSHASCGSYKYKDTFIPESEVHFENLVQDKENCLSDAFVLPKPGETKNLPGFFPFHKQFHVSYLIIAGLSDVCMPAKFSADEEENLLMEVCHPDYEIIRYPDTGHLIEPPYAPLCDVYYQSGEPFNTYLKGGGEIFQHCKAQEDCWSKALQFLKQRLVPNPIPENAK